MSLVGRPRDPLMAFLDNNESSIVTRRVTIPKITSHPDELDKVSIDISFKRSDFETEDLPKGGKKIEIPNGIQVTREGEDFVLSITNRRTPIKVGSSTDGLEIAIDKDHVKISPKGESGVGAFNLRLNVDDLLAGFTYLQGEPDKRDSGIDSKASDADLKSIHKKQ